MGGSVRRACPLHHEGAILVLGQFTLIFRLGSAMSVPDREADENVVFTGEMLSCFLKI